MSTRPVLSVPRTVTTCPWRLPRGGVGSSRFREPSGSQQRGQRRSVRSRARDAYSKPVGWPHKSQPGTSIAPIIWWILEHLCEDPGAYPRLGRGGRRTRVRASGPMVVERVALRRVADRDDRLLAVGPVVMLDKTSGG